MSQKSSLPQSTKSVPKALTSNITDLSSVTTVGLDLAKHVTHVHGVDALVGGQSFPRRSGATMFWFSSPNCLSVLRLPK
jgi:hypothetical protein